MAIGNKPSAIESWRPCLQKGQFFFSCPPEMKVTMQQTQANDQQTFEKRLNRKERECIVVGY